MSWVKNSTKRFALGGLNLVVGLIVAVVALLLGLLSALPIALSGVDASGIPVTAGTRFTQLLFAVGTVGFALAFAFPIAGWLTRRVSNLQLARASLVGIGFAALSAIAAATWTMDLGVALALAGLFGLLALPLALNAWVVRSAARRETTTVERESPTESVRPR